jgi:hypothetical protein
MTEDDVGRIGGFVCMVAKRTRVSLLRVIICGRAPNVSDADGSPTSEYLVECHKDKLDRPRLEPRFPDGGWVWYSYSFSRLCVLLDVVGQPICQCMHA